MADEDVDFEPDEVETTGMDAEEGEASSAPKAAATGAAAAAAAPAKKVKGRGAKTGGQDRYSGRGGTFESVSDSSGSGPCRSVEGWIVMVTGVHEEAQEDQVLDAFADHGEVKNINVNLDRRTGYVKVGW